MSKMKTSLYNNESLCSEAQLLLSSKPDNMSMTEWRKIMKEFKALLSAEDLKEFERLKANAVNANLRAKKLKVVKQIEVGEINLYDEGGQLHSEAQLLLSTKPDEMPLAVWRKRMKEFKSQLSVEDLKEFKRLKAKKYDAKQYANNTERAKAHSINWRANNPEKAKANSAAGNAKHRAENPSYTNDYHKQRRAKDPLYRLQQSMRSTCNGIIKRLSLGKKPVSTFKWIGCSPEELKAHLESLFTEGMTWENYGKYGWHVDHIRPVCSFSAEEWEQVNHYTNLQPLWAEDNYTKISSDLKQKRYWRGFN